MIAKSSKLSYIYARYVLKGRFLNGEAAIARIEEFSCDYATDILKERFELFEKFKQSKVACIKESYYWDRYCSSFKISQK